MTFLNPLVLIGLVAAGIPVLIHLLQLKKLRQIDFSSIRFLKEIQHATARRIKLRDYLLLLVRTLAIASLVMAFARPAIKGIAGVNETSASVMIIDNSPSTTARNENGEVYSQEKDAAASILNDFHPGDDVSLMFTSSAGDTSMTYSSIYPNSLLSRITRSGPSSVWGSYSTAIRAAIDRLSNAGYVDKEIYLIGDLQRTQFVSDTSSITPPATPSLQNVKVFFVRTAESPGDNLSVTSVLFPNPVVEAGVPTEVDATVRNNGASQKGSVVVSLFVDSRKLAQSVVDIPGKTEKKVRLSFSVQQNGFHSGVVQIEDNSVQVDNNFYFSFYAIQKLNVGVVVNDTSSDFVISAINAVTSASNGLGAESDSTIQIGTKAILPQQFTFSNLAGTDVLVVESYLDNIDFASKIVRFVEGGGGAVLFAPLPSQEESFDRLISEMKLGTVKSFFSSPSGSFIGLDKIDVGDKFFSGMFASQESADQIKSQLVTKIFSGCEINPNPFDHVLMSTSSGPFLLGREAGSGFVFAVTTPADTSASNFPMSPFFPIVVQRTLFFASAVKQAPIQTITGHSVEYRLSGGGAQVAKLYSPYGDNASVLPRYAGNTAVFRLSGLDKPGTYSLVANDTICEVSANIDPRASDLAQASTSDISLFAGSLGISSKNVFVVNAGKNTAATIERLKVGRDLSSFFAGAALFFLILEILISRMKTFPGQSSLGDSREGSSLSHA